MDDKDEDQGSISGSDRLDGYEDSAATPQTPGVSLQQALARLGLGVGAAAPALELEQLADALGSRLWQERQSAILALGKLGDRAPLELVLRGLTDKHDDVRAATARVLGMLGERAPVEPLVVALSDAAWYVRAAAAQALGKLRGSIAVQALVEALGDEDESVRAAAIGALRMADDVPLAPLLAAAHDRSWIVREAAVLALGELANRLLPPG
jgi:HEAT repeat protein